MRFIFHHSPFAVHTHLPSVLLCLDPVGPISHQQQIYNFSAYEPFNPRTFQPTLLQANKRQALNDLIPITVIELIKQSYFLRKRNNHVNRNS